MKRQSVRKYNRAPTPSQRARKVDRRKKSDQANWFFHKGFVDMEVSPGAEGQRRSAQGSGESSFSKYLLDLVLLHGFLREDREGETGGQRDRDNASPGLSFRRVLKTGSTPL